MMNGSMGHATEQSHVSTAVDMRDIPAALSLLSTVSAGITVLQMRQLRQVSFFGTESQYNHSYIVDIPKPTNQIAELTAGIYGLELALLIQQNERFEEGSRLSEVVIKADSEYLVKGMTEWIFKWEKNGHKTAKGTPVVNAELFKRLQQLVVALNDRTVQVLFWHVPREYNKVADSWASLALKDGWD